MKLVIMTRPTFFVEEDKILVSLFDEGMENLHINKQESSPLYTERLLSLIPEDYHKKITVHQHFYLKEEYGLAGIHLDSETDNIPTGYKGKVSRTCSNLENLKLLNYLKYTDKEGVQRDLALGTINGRAVLVDDNMPVEQVAASGNDAAYTKYTTYVLGDGAIEYTNCGVKVPYEVSRNPAKNGGQDLLYGRQRKIFAPYGISWTDSTIISPTDAQLETGSKWSLANSNESTKEYF